MELTLDTPDGKVKHEAKLLCSNGEFLAGTLRFEFRGLFPVDPLPYMDKPPPPPLPGGGWSCYEVPPPERSVSFHTDTTFYVCRVESVRSDGFTLAPHTAVNLLALKELVRIKVPD